MFLTKREESVLFSIDALTSKTSNANLSAIGEITIPALSLGEVNLELRRLLSKGLISIISPGNGEEKYAKLTYLGQDEVQRLTELN